jgi:hypothetical protein
MSRSGRLLLQLFGGASLLVAPAAAAPDFVPKPSDVYERYTALGEPRSELPVGALWIQGYGAYGDGAAADNVVTLKSLTGVAINRELQLSVTAGLLKLFGVDPSYRSRVTARFTDLSIVQVKDPAKLAGPVGELRIVEALRAGTITISTESDFELDLQTVPQMQSLPVIGQGESGRRRSWTIDGKDMFIAFRVASLRSVREDELKVPLRRSAAGIEAEFDDYRMVFDTTELDRCVCGAAATADVERCKGEKPVAMRITNLGSSVPAAANGEVPRLFAKDPAPALELALPVPRADGKGGLFTSISIRLKLSLSAQKNSKHSPQCASKLGRTSELLVAYQGRRLEALSRPEAPGWYRDVANLESGPGTELLPPRQARLEFSSGLLLLPVSQRRANFRQTQMSLSS